VQRGRGPWRRLVPPPAPGRRETPIPRLSPALVALTVVLPGVAHAECFRLIDFQTDHAGEPLRSGDDLSLAYAAWSVELGAPDPEAPVPAVAEEGDPEDLAAGGLAVHVVHFEDPFCVRSVDLDGFTGGQAAVTPQCFDGTSLPPIRAEDPGTQAYDELCGIGTLRIEFWERDVAPSWDDLCIDLDPGTIDGPCGDMSAADPPAAPVFEDDDPPPVDATDSCAGCDDDAVMAWPGLVLLGGFGRRRGRDTL